MALRFTEMPPSVPQNAGDTGGDAQVGEAFSRRFVAPLGAGKWLVLVVAFYVLDLTAAMASDGPQRLVLVRQEITDECGDPWDIEADGDGRADVRDMDVPGEPTEGNAFLACAAYNPGEEFAPPWEIAA